MSGTRILKVISMLALLILTVSSVSPVLNHLLLTGEPAAAIAWANPAVTVQMTSPGLVENVWFADHVNDLATGNWIELSGGTAVNLPYLRFDYSGVGDSTFTKAGKTVNIHSSSPTRSVIYPLTTHPVYMPGNSITANFRGESGLNGVTANYKLVQGSLTDWEQAYTDLLTNADLTKLKAILSAAVITRPITFGVDGDVSDTFPAPMTPGDYVLLAVYENTGPGTYDLVVFGATPVEVLDYAMTTTAPASVTAGDSFSVSFTMTGAAASTYRYGAVIISQAAYRLIASLQTTGALSATDLFLNGVLVAEGTGTITGTPAINLVGFTFGSLDVNVVTSKTALIFGASNIAIAFSNPTSSTTGAVSVQTGAGMPSGTYVLLMGVWDSGGNKLVAFKQSTVTLSTPPPPPTNQPPTASISGPAEAVEGDSVSFSGSGSSDTDGTVVGYFWEFGDGGSGVGASASHTYTTPGTYTVSLRVTDNLGASGTTTASILIKANQAPTASISGPSEGKINLAVSFSGVGTDADGTIASYAWAFGDGGSGTGSSVSHTYTVAGTYTVTLTVTDNKGKTGTATASVKIFNPPPLVEDIKKDTPEDAAAKLEETLSTDAAAILDDLPPQTAADIVEALTVEKAVDILVVMNVASAAQIVEKLPVETAVAIVDSAVTGDNLEGISNILTEMNDQQAARILVDVAPANAAEVIQVMATQNLNDAAKTVEAVVKLFIQELDPDLRKEIKKKVKDIFDNVSVESLVALFIEIANLPNTPSTVAAVFESMDPAKVLDVITGIGAQGAWTELGNVFGYLTQATLGTIYSAMPTTQRGSVSPYLSAQTVALLPKVGTYQVAAMSVTPASVGIGGTATVTVRVTNVGAYAGTHDVALKVNGATEQTKTVALNAGASTDVSFTVSKSAAGTYTVAVETQSASLVITQPKAAAFTLAGLQISKTSANVGEQLTVTVTVSNTGELSGSYPIKVMLDGVEKFSESITLDGGKSVTKTYTVASSAAGVHTVAVDGSNVQFTVAAPPMPAPVYTWYLLGAVAVVVAAVLIYLLTKKK